MKTTSRIHRNGATKAVKTQIRKPARADAEHQHGDIDLVLFSNRGGTSKASINLSDEEFGRLKNVAAAQKISLDDLLVQGFERMVKPARPSPQFLVQLRELEMSKDSAGSLLGLALQNADSGLKNLANMVIMKLEADFAAVSAACKMPAAESISAPGGAE